MFRITQFMREIAAPTPLGPKRAPPGPVVIWNLIRRCNLKCRHCYAFSADLDFPGELDTAEVFAVLEDLKGCRVPALVLSGGEPLMRPDIFEITRRAKALGFYVALSSNGTLIERHNITDIAAAGYDYVGISLDGIGATHDHFRGVPGAFEASMRGLALCRDRGIKVGLRFTLTRDNFADLPGVLALLDQEGVDKFYLSHLNYAGRGNRNRGDDAHFAMTRAAMEQLFDHAWEQVRGGNERELVSGNNDADGVYLLHWAARRWPECRDHLRAKLAQWGGNASGRDVANIDNLGEVHPDTFWSHHALGNVRARPFSEIWRDTSDPIMAGLKATPRPLKGRCGACRYLDVCGGNTRVRAYRLSGDPWAEDPGCYLSDAEIGRRSPDAAAAS
jgi:heme d1 biosynthesis radical SAM protein NirJ